MKDLGRERYDAMNGGKWPVVGGGGDAELVESIVSESIKTLRLPSIFHALF